MSIPLFFPPGGTVPLDTCLHVPSLDILIVKLRPDLPIVIVCEKNVRDVIAKPYNVQRTTLYKNCQSKTMHALFYLRENNSHARKGGCLDDSFFLSL